MWFNGAVEQIRTADLVITNDVLCQLSYISTTAYKLYQMIFYLSIVFLKKLKFCHCENINN